MPSHAVPISLGVPRADAWLGGGLRSDGLHEFFAGLEDLPAALSFALLLAMKRAAPASADEGAKGEAPRAGLLWLRRASDGVPYGPGLADMGLDPGEITILQLADERAMLRAALDAVRAGAVGAVMLESVGRQKLLDLTATRRLVLAAAETNTVVLLVRAGDKPGLSAAHSRWAVRSAPSRPLAADAPGFPVFDLTLLRQRGGRDGLHILLEWNREAGGFGGGFGEWEDRQGAAQEGRQGYGHEGGRHGTGATPLSGGFPAMDADGACADPQGRAA